MSYALLDDCDASATQARSRLYTGLVRELASYGADDVDAVCAQATQATREGLHAVVVADYEWGALVSDDRIAPEVVAKAQAGKPALRFLLFRQCERLSRDEVDRWLAKSDAEPAGLVRVTPDTSRDRFDNSIEAIHAALERGDTYQINYTYRLGFDAFGSPVSLYRRLRARQPVRYGALIALPDGRFVLSCSPELFLRHENGVLHAQPMKGTAARVDDHDADARVRESLRTDPKNRAENLMIVDLLRNDIGRVAQTGSVSVPELFSVDPYGSVWQMTSTVRATLRAGLAFSDVMRALFPCGSITGAPKHRAMELIASLETSARGLYTGSIGWLEAPAGGQQCGDFCLSVAIRTLVLDAGAQTGQMGVGAGIVLDSIAASEWEECKVKAAFATGLDSSVGIFETMRATRAGGVVHLDRHLSRLVHSATELGIRVDAAAILEQVNAYLPMLSEGEHRVRLALDPHGHVEIGSGPLVPLTGPTVNVLLADEYGFAPTNPADPLLRYKTTARETYDKAWRMADTHGAFDMLFFNSNGELTEGGRTNVLVRLDGHWYTPPLACGLLPGVMRALLLEDASWNVTERVLSRDDVLRADSIVLCNALRGAMPARLVHADATQSATVHG